MPLNLDISKRQSFSSGSKVVDDLLGLNQKEPDLLSLISPLMSAGQYSKGLAKTLLEISKNRFGKSRLLPALQIKPGVPDVAENVMTGSLGGSHGDLYRYAPPGFQKHGYVDPNTGSFLDDALYGILGEPEKAKRAGELLNRGVSVEALLDVLKAVPPTR